MTDAFDHICRRPDEIVQTPQATIMRYGAGKLPYAYNAGDFFVVRDWHEDFLGWLIEAQGMADVGTKNSDANVSHSGCIVSQFGNIVEGNASGWQGGNIEKYRDADLYIVHPLAPTPDQINLTVAKWNSLVGMSYDDVGFLAFFSRTLFGIPWVVSDEHGLICSAGVAYGLLASRVSFTNPYQAMTPTMLLVDYGLRLLEPPVKANFLQRFLLGLVAVGKIVRSVF